MGETGGEVDAPPAIAGDGGSVAITDEEGLAEMSLPDGPTIRSGLEPSPPETEGGAGTAKPCATGPSARSSNRLTGR